MEQRIYKDLAREQHYQNTRVLQHLFARIEEVGLDIQLGRGNTDNSNHTLIVTLLT